MRRRDLREAWERAHCAERDLAEQSILQPPVAKDPLMATPRFHARAALICAALALALAVFGFFQNLSTALTDYSWGDASYITQAFYNFTVGHPFQTSLYHNPGHGVIENSAPYANQAAIHINLTPFLFVPFFALRPDVYGLYALTTILVMLSALVAVLDLLRRSPSPPGDVSVRRMIALALLLSSSLFRLAHYKGHWLLFATPFFLCMDAAARRKNIPAYLGAAALTALVGEDSAMLVMSYASYLWLCDRDFRRPAAVAAAGAAAVLAVMVFVLMPAARYEMVQENSSHMLYILSDPWTMLAGVEDFPIWARIALIFVPALAALRLALNPGPRSSDRRLLALVLIAPASHWLMTLLSYGAHHLVPPLLCMVLAASLLLTDGTSAWSVAPRRKAALACASLYAVLSLWNVSKDLPERRSPGARAESAANRAFIAEVRRLVPRDATLVIWADQAVEAFLADRTSLWRFPEFYADADYLAIEPGAQKSWLGNPPSDRLSMRETAAAPHWTDLSPIPPASAALIKQELVDRSATHTTVLDVSSVLLLKRKVRKPFLVPASSLGFGYFRHLPGLKR